MKNPLSSFENRLPHWLEKTQLQWVQWVYALWQILRCNPLTLLVVSFLPFYILQRYKKKRVVVVGSSKDYDMHINDLKPYMDRGDTKHSMNMELVSFEHPTGRPLWCRVKHNEHYYIAHQVPVRELAGCSRDLGENIIFVERLLPVSASLAVGKMLSQTEAYEKVMSKRYHCSKGPKFVVPTWLDYFDLSSKFWVVLSTIPILLQAQKYEKSSNLLSLLIILLDFNRVWLYKLYHRIFNRFTKYVKLNIFKQRTELYDFFSIFSSRWKYSDTVKKYAYVAQPGDTMKIRWYSKLKYNDDLKIDDWEYYGNDPNDQHIFMELFPDNSHYRAECNMMVYNDVAAIVTLNKKVCPLITILKVCPEGYTYDVY